MNSDRSLFLDFAAAKAQLSILRFGFPMMSVVASGFYILEPLCGFTEMGEKGVKGHRFTS